MILEGQKKLIQIENKSISLAVPFYHKKAIDWIKEAKQIKSFKSFLNLSPFPTGFKNLLEKVFSVAYFVGYTFSKDFIEKQFEEPFFKIDFDKYGFDEALVKLLNKKIISPESFKKLKNQFSNISWSIQRIERFDALIVLRNSLLNAIDSGLSLSDWKDEIDSIFENYGITPLSPHHIETVFRTNLSSVYSQASFDAMTEDPNTEALQYIAVMDDRVRDEHAALNEFIARVDDPIWNTIKVPNGYNCRCSIIPLSEYYLNKNNLNFSKKTKEINEAVKSIPPEFKSNNMSMSDLEKELQALEMVKENESIKLQDELIE